MSFILSDTNNPRLRRPSPERLKALEAHPPYEILRKTLENASLKKPVQRVLYWFRNKDLRVYDNAALHYASQKANDANVSLITLYLYCPNSLIWQGISKARMDFLLETLRSVQSTLHGLNIPLIILTLNQLSDTSSILMPFFERYGISDLYANYEYEVDELRRDIQLVGKIRSNINFFYYHDQCVIEPGTLRNQQNKPFQVFTAYHKSWLNHIKQCPSLIKTYPSPYKQSSIVRNQRADLFESRVPEAPHAKSFDSLKEREALRILWPSGYPAALEKLEYFIQAHLAHYATFRNNPALDVTSRMSPYLAIGAISVRTLLTRLKEYNHDRYDFSSSSSPPGLFSWVREIVFREFYRHQLINRPHLSMNLPQNAQFAAVHWENDAVGWKKWCSGQTGSPWIDAGMRQLKQEAYMHNRLRMNVASYLYGNLLIDYRRGEQYFADMLIDFDLANNVQGWSPSYTLFNPVLQAEKNDPQGDYIRKWVPELRSVQGKAIFDPYHRLSLPAFEALHYPKPYINWVETKERARKRFKVAMHKNNTPIPTT
jgi:deoxyribodipyrimidine photo-lyase